MRRAVVVGLRTVQGCCAALALVPLGIARVLGDVAGWLERPRA